MNYTRRPTISMPSIAQAGGGLFAGGRTCRVRHSATAAQTHPEPRNFRTRDRVRIHPASTHYMVEGGGFEPPKLARQIYSLIPLATREPLRKAAYCPDGPLPCQLHIPIKLRTYTLPADPARGAGQRRAHSAPVTPWTGPRRAASGACPATPPRLRMAGAHAAAALSHPRDAVTVTARSASLQTSLFTTSLAT